MNFSYTNQVLSNILDQSKVIMDLNGTISEVFLGPDVPHVVGSLFAQEMRFHAKEGRKVIVYINSDGGDVDAGWAIVQAIKDTQADTHVVGRATSMAAYAALFGKRRTANEFARIQLHGASSNHKDMEDVVNEQLTTLLQKISNMSESRITNIIEKRGREIEIFTANQAVDAGLIDEIIPSVDSKDPMDISTASGNELYKAYASLINPKSNKKSMKKVIAHFGLNAEASEEAILEAVATLESKVEAKETENKDLVDQVSELTEKLKKFEDKEKELTAKAAKELVDAGIEAGKIKEEAKDKWVGLATADFDGTKELIDGIEVSTEKLSAQGNLKKEKKEDGKELYDGKTAEECFDFVNSGNADFDEMEEEKRESIFAGYDAHMASIEK